MQIGRMIRQRNFDPVLTKFLLNTSASVHACKREHHDLDPGGWNRTPITAPPQQDVVLADCDFVEGWKRSLPIPWAMPDNGTIQMMTKI